MGHCSELFQLKVPTLFKRGAMFFLFTKLVLFSFPKLFSQIATMVCIHITLIGSKSIHVLSASEN